MEKSDELVFEELELQEDLFWEYVAAGSIGVAGGIVVYVAIAT
ncbi:hypothetical protein [Clostridium saccharobutylicum]|uniref:Uncharacterized protein n=1 Tax=Clostridium saccharobutylicum DSM 13864 TaxID=1345695 RepID=U5ML67_CLOSA|nr:hypothetical protein [Clostridium saccharobutylicum]AGX41350.1 hypothetical protein CLSA_c02980 [Clostridium saccharobutylicum DSM 13864]AQR88633.1 hypothetical protein CLOSC_02950 [Clostridium saccharobutylicum]AQR98531.1 hypothetical protein CSACC_02950 [Clostridium saccharobutylicum]AQS08243.1 hypothetical protein CLOBY_03130 [Clostridium saccharobutylicum]AQS12521.1 hypothetical protein CLOSACC_02950 [Clostridium saccharobutylicum]